MGGQSNFGAGYLWATGTNGAVFTAPLLLGALQDISVDESQELKPLYGQPQWPIEQGTGKRKTDIKVSLARLDPNLFNQVYYGGTTQTGQTLASNLEQHPVPTTPFQVTVTNSATWVADLGVYSQGSGKFLTKVASSPATGQYSVAAGVYTFNTAQSGVNMQISYTYTATGGYTVASGNPAMGVQNTFSLNAFNTFKGVSFGRTFNCVQSSKLSFGSKLDDWTLPSLDMSAQDDGTGNVSTMYLNGWT